ncbi:heterodisulfide reductase subunit A-like protein [Ornatilinea apprima]|uniref:Heterodisulfide reductase subunit A-like protein n=1 Tax=Ornatilinea apprima TaxID=1134406 RepID=A0A0P6WMJ1_9CHLR|nr:heterodisulfide reductase subunit A-like protein [Ornatilinea apprima]KPL69993.1 heterodisulfide reductase subunit A-like protein [Ornatilinea apprima]
MSNKGLLLCVCQGNCPSFQQMNIFEVGNALRREKLVDYVAIHPQLCSKDGDVFLTTLLKGDSTDELYVAACDPTMQVKMFRDAMEAAGFDKQRIHGVDIRNLDTDQAVGAIKQMIAGG